MVRFMQSKVQKEYARHSKEALTLSLQERINRVVAFDSSAERICAPLKRCALSLMVLIRPHHLSLSLSHVIMRLHASFVLAILVMYTCSFIQKKGRGKG